MSRDSIQAHVATMRRATEQRIQELRMQASRLEHQATQFEALLEDSSMLEIYARELTAPPESRLEDSDTYNALRGAIQRLLSEAEVAVRSGQIGEALEAQGYAIDPEFLTSVLEGFPEFVTIGRGWWRLRGEGDE